MLLGYGMPPKTQKIDEPVANRPAAMAGLKAGDVLVEANGQTVNADHPISEVIQAGQGAPVAIKVLRDGQEMVFTSRPTNKAGVYQVGIQIGPIDDRTPVSFGTAIKEAVVYPVLRVGRDPERALRHDSRQGPGRPVRADRHHQADREGREPRRA